jgi:hypothetical protein
MKGQIAGVTTRKQYIDRLEEPRKGDIVKLD